MVYTCKKARTYIVLRSSKVSKSKPLAKQGKTIRMKCSGSTVASKYASAVYKKSKRKIKSVILYRKGTVSRYSITCKQSSSGKLKFSAKLTSKSTVSTSKKTTKRRKRKTKRKTKKTKRKTKKSKRKTKRKSSKTKGRKRCPNYSRRSASKKSCLKNKLVIKRRSKALTKARSELKKAKKALASRRKQLAKSTKSMNKTKAGTKARTRSKATVRKYKNKVATKSKTVSPPAEAGQQEEVGAGVGEEAPRQVSFFK